MIRFVDDFARHAWITAAVTLLFVATGCHELAGDVSLPAGIQDPATYNTPAGARQVARGTRILFGLALRQAVGAGALLTDEVRSGTFGGDLDRRSMNADAVALYFALAKVRGQSQLARGALRKYASDVPTALVGEQFAWEAYADLYLGDLFCSGIPLSTLQFEGDFTYEPGSTTTQVYRRASELFDSIMTLGVDSVSVLSLARIGRARALLALGQFDSAATVAAVVPTDFAYGVRVGYIGFGDDGSNAGFSESDREGGIGEAYFSSGDPRTAGRAAVSPHYGGYAYIVPVKADSVDSLTITIADGVEARLIEAEADIRHHGTTWLTTLNALRTTGAFTVKVRSNIPGQSPGPAEHPDTTWAPGTGASLIASAVAVDTLPVCDPDPAVTCTDTVWYRGLAPLTDPAVLLQGQAATDARLDLLYHERAFWLYFTGRRQGDLRRMLRQSPGRTQAHAYPSGAYRDWFAPTVGLYESAVNLAVPAQAEQPNTLYQGCFNRDP